MSDIRLTQYFGPSPRYPFACVELDFPADSRTFDLTAVSRAFAQAGLPLHEGLPEDRCSLPEAVGRLARMILRCADPEACIAGTDGNRAWIALFHPVPRLAGETLRLCREAILAAHAPGGALPDAVRGLATIQPPMNPTVLTLLRAAAELGLDSVIASQFAQVHQTGQGAAGKHFHSLGNEDDSLTGDRLSKDKRATIELLGRAGLPTTRSVVVRSREPIEEIVRQVGFPCVVKPRFGMGGEGVFPGLRTIEAVREAIAAGEKAGRPMLLENHVPGDDHRILVVAGEVQWAYRRQPPYVRGDGQATVAELVERENQRRRSADPAARPFLHDLVLDEARRRFLADRHGMDFASVPGTGQRIDLTGPANIMQGGTLKDMTERLHPDVRELAIRIARLFRVNALGIDYMTTDIGQSWRDSGGAVIEVNCTPGIGAMRDGCLALRTMFPRRLSGRVPSFVVCGDEAWAAQTATALTRALHALGLAVGEAAYRPDAGPIRGSADLAPYSATREITPMLLDTRVEAMVLTADPRAIVRCGLPLQRCDVLLTGDEALPPGFSAFADRTIAERPDPAALAALAGEVAGRYRDAALDGARPHLEWAESEPDAPDIAVLRCWRMRALARDWWRAQLADAGLVAEPDLAGGMIVADDLCAAALAFANAELAQAGAPPIAGAFSFAQEDHAFAAPWREARIALDPVAAARQRQALGSGIERVNALVG